MPKLGRNQTAGLVNCLDNAPPHGKLGVTIEARAIGMIQRSGSCDADTFRNDQADAVLGPTPVVIDRPLGRHALRTHVAGHRRHDGTIGYRQALEGEGFEEAIDHHSWSMSRMGKMRSRRELHHSPLKVGGAVRSVARSPPRAVRPLLDRLHMLPSPNSKLPAAPVTATRAKIPTSARYRAMPRSSRPTRRPQRCTTAIAKAMFRRRRRLLTNRRRISRSMRPTRKASRPGGST